jgi:hypothetical protein
MSLGWFSSFNKILLNRKHKGYLGGSLFNGSRIAYCGRIGSGLKVWRGRLGFVGNSYCRSRDRVVYVEGVSIPGERREKASIENRGVDQDWIDRRL